MNGKRPVGWRGESYRHALASRGIKTSDRKRRTGMNLPLGRAREIGDKYAVKYSSIKSLYKYGGIDLATNEIQELNDGNRDDDFYMLMDAFWETYESAMLHIPTEKKEIKDAILEIIDRGDNDIRDIDAALYEIDFNDALEELIEEGSIREVDHDSTYEYYRT